jgi:hypothetical protein
MADVESTLTNGARGVPGDAALPKETVMNKYLFIYRIPESLSPARQRTPDELTAMYARWNAWKDQFKANIVDVGDGLKSTGKVLRNEAVTDGPHVEAKEVIGGYSMVQAESYEQALAVARPCPVSAMPGAYIEIREMAGFG